MIAGQALLKDHFSVGFIACTIFYTSLTTDTAPVLQFVLKVF